jgi:hypothetical protein
MKVGKRPEERVYWKREYEQGPNIKIHLESKIGTERKVWKQGTHGAIWKTGEASGVHSDQDIELAEVTWSWGNQEGGERQP